MGILDLTGVGEVADLAKTAINKIWPDKTEEEKAQLAAVLAIIQGQMDINKIEAASTNWFTSGWRPFIGWTCGFGLLYASAIDPMARWIAVVIIHYTGGFPVIDTTITMQILMGMLGLGGLRSFDKLKGTAL